MAEQSLEIVLKARYDAGGIATAAKGLSSSLDAMRRREFDVSHDARERELRDVDEYYLKVRARAESQSKRLIEAETNVLTRQFEAGVAGKPTDVLDRQFAALQAQRRRVEETLQQANVSQELQRTALRERRTAAQVEQWGADTSAAQAPGGERGFLTRGLARVAGPAAAIGISAAAVAAVAQAQRAREEIRSAHEDGNRFAELRARQALDNVVADFHARIPLIGGAIKTAMDAWGDRAGIDKLIGNLESASGRIQQMQLAIRAATAQGAAGIGGGLPGSFGLIMRSGAAQSQLLIEAEKAEDERRKAESALRRANDMEVSRWRKGSSEKRRIAIAEADKQRGLTGGIAEQRKVMLDLERQRSSAEVGVARREEAAAVTRSLGERAFAQETADATPENARRRELHGLDSYLAEQKEKYAGVAVARQQLERQVTAEAEMEAARRLQGKGDQFPGLRAQIVAAESARIRAIYTDEFKALADLEAEGVQVVRAATHERETIVARQARLHREELVDMSSETNLARLRGDDRTEAKRRASLAEIDLRLKRELRANAGDSPEAVEKRAALTRRAEVDRGNVIEQANRIEEASFRDLVRRRTDAEAGASRDVMRIRDREIEKLREGYDEQIRLAEGNARMIAALEAARDAQVEEHRVGTAEENRRRRTGIEIEVLRAGGQTLAAREKEIGEKYAEMRRQAGGNASELASIAGLERRDLALARARDANPVTREVGMIESRFLRNAPGFDDPALRTTEELRKANDILGQIAKSLAGGTRLTVRTVSLRGA